MQLVVSHSGPKCKLIDGGAGSSGRHRVGEEKGYGEEREREEIRRNTGEER